MVNDADLAHQLAHELRGPLMGIKGLSSTATKLYDRLTDDERREFFHLIDQEAGRLAKVANQMAMLLILQADDLRSHPAPVELRALVSTVAEDERVSLVDGPDVTARADPKWSAEIVSELLDNALRYSEGPVSVTVETAGNTAFLRVADTGTPLPLDLRDKAFERFAGVRPAGAEDVPGAGIGLFLARALAEVQGGTLSMEGRDTGGTMLTLGLPVEGQGRER